MTQPKITFTDIVNGYSDEGLEFFVNTQSENDDLFSDYPQLKDAIIDLTQAAITIKEIVGE